MQPLAGMQSRAVGTRQVHWAMMAHIPRTSVIQTASAASTCLHGARALGPPSESVPRVGVRAEERAGFIDAVGKNAKWEADVLR
jgi:hypothetical protein